jgi:hypothetical protein
MRVQILLNTNERESFVRGYQQDDELMRVYDGDKGIPPMTTTEALEYIYSSNQYIDAVHRPWYEGRSLSMGDVICINDAAYAVERVGFRELDGFEVPS